MYLLLISQSSKCTAGLPVRKDPLRVVVRREEAHHAPGNHVANVGENAPGLIHLQTTKCASVK